MLSLVLCRKYCIFFVGENLDKFHILGGNSQKFNENLIECEGMSLSTGVYIPTSMVSKTPTNY